MKKLFPILAVTLALFAGPLIGQDAEQPIDAPDTQESAETADEETPADGELIQAAGTETEEGGHWC